MVQLNLSRFPSIDDWRRQKVEDHKFDFIDVEDYVDNSVWRKFKYSLVFAIVIKGILVYCADLWYVFIYRPGTDLVVGDLR